MVPAERSSSDCSPITRHYRRLLRNQVRDVCLIYCSVATPNKSVWLNTQPILPADQPRGSVCGACSVDHPVGHPAPAAQTLSPAAIPDEISGTDSAGSAGW